MRATARRGRLGILGLGLVAAAACSPDRTMLVVRVESNMAVPAALDRVRIVVRHGGKELQNLPFSLVGGSRQLPLEVGLLSPSGGGTGVGVTVTGSLKGTDVVSEEAVTSFVKGKSLLLEMFLAAECVNFDCQDPDKTCTRGQKCVDKTRPPETLHVFTPQPETDAGTADAKSDRAEAGDAAGGFGGADAAAGTGGAGGGGAGGAGGGSGGGGGAAGGDGGVDQLDALVEAAPEVPACVPLAEDCFNGKDDDCDGKPDCADSDCTPTMVCVPRPTGSVGTTVDGMGACPAGFSGTPTQLSNNLQNGGTSCASGCKCGTGATSCKADLYAQTDPLMCASNTGGKLVYTMSTADPDLCPVPDTNTTNVYGARLTPWAVTTTGCPPGGAPVKPTPQFGKQIRFCGADKLNATAGNGCTAGWVCAPRGAPGRSCALFDSAGGCPSPAVADLYYTGFTDGRTCAACSCAQSGATCDNLYVKMGSDYSCMNVDTGHIKGGMATCTTQSFGVYVPGYELVGTPTPPTCTPTSAVLGTLSPTGGRTLCCVQ